MKKSLSIILAAIMLLSVLTIAPFSAGALSNEKFEYSVINDEVRIDRYIATNSSGCTIPDTIDGYPVTSIASGAFADNKKLTGGGVVIPKSVTTIGNGAFTNMNTNVVFKYKGTAEDWKNKVTIGSDNEMITQSRMIYNFGELLSYRIIDSKVKIYGTNEKAETLEIPDTIEGYPVTEILGYAFEDCHETKTYILPDSVTTIGYAAFQISSFEKLYLGSGLKYISTDAFDDTILTDVYYNGTQAEWEKVEVESGNDSLKNATMHYAEMLDEAAVINVSSPAAGMKPVMNAVSSSPEHYTVESVSWYNTTDSKDMTETDTFEEGKQYKLSVTLIPARGYRFDINNMTDDSVQINGEGYAYLGKRTSASLEINKSYIARKTIGSVIIKDVVEPVIGEATQTTVTLEDTCVLYEAYWYNVTDDKSAGERFEADKEYRFVVDLESAEGYRFADTVTSTINGKTSQYNLHASNTGIVIWYDFPRLLYGTISEIEVTGVVEPKGGECPVYNFTPAGEFTISDVYWTLSDSSLDYPELTPYDTFEAGKKYSLNFYVHANDGYEFSEDAKVYFNDETDYHTAFDIFGEDPAKNRRVGIIYTAAEAPTELTNVALTNLAEPVAGAHPTTTVTAPDGVTVYGVSWFDGNDNQLTASDVFAPEKEYYADIYIQTKSGYKFSVSEDKTAVTATVNGKEAKVSGINGYSKFNYLCVSAAFMTDKADEVISSVDIAGVTPPAVGERPTFEGITFDSNYGTTYEINMSYTPNQLNYYNETDKMTLFNIDTFYAGKQYSFNVYLKAKDGYTFASEDYSSTVNATVNGKTANVTFFSSKSIVIQYCFDALPEPVGPSKSNDIGYYKLSGIKNKTYTGKAISQKITLVDTENNYTLVPNTDYIVSYVSNKNVGTATVIITAVGDFEGSIIKTFKITKADNPIKVTPVTKSVKLKTVKKKTVTVKGAVKVTKAQGKLSYKITSAPKAIKKYLKISSKGVITVKKWAKAKKSSYKIKVKVTAKGTSNYKSKSVTKTIKLKVK